MIQPATLNFLSTLAKNNNRDWFEKNRSVYATSKANVEAFLDELILELGKVDPLLADLEGKKSLFRINRDVRFSKNKAPYKTNFGASLSPGGRKSPLPGLYIHIEPNQAFLAGGVWMPEPPVLAAIRQEIDYNLDDFESIIKNKKFKATFGNLNQDDKLVNVPKGYAKDTPSAEYIKLKSFIVMNTLSTTEILSKTFVKKCVETYKVMYPMNQFLRQAMEEVVKPANSAAKKSKK